MPRYKRLMVSAASSGAVAGLALGGAMYLLGRRFINEFTRPGVVASQHDPKWGGWAFPTDAVEPPPATQRSVTIPSADGTVLLGEFWAQDKPAPTIIISHGFHLPSVFFRSVAALEYAGGANILLFDYRGHGESPRIPTTCGNAEVNDLLAAIDVVVDQPETLPNKVYIHGFSMGAAVALLLPPHPAVAGIISDSAYARLDEMIRIIMTQIFDDETAGLRGPARWIRPFIPSLTHLTLFSGRLMFLARHRSPLVAYPERVIRDSLKGRTATGAQPPILLIHSEHDPLISLRHAHRLEEAALTVGRSIQAYYTPSHIHCGSYGYDPHRYITLLRGFMEVAVA